MPDIGVGSPSSWSDGWAPIAAFFDAGGPVVIVLLGLSVLGLAVILLKTVQFALLRLRDESFLAPALKRIAEGDTDSALAMLKRVRNPLARVIEPAARTIPAGDSALLREEMERTARGVLEHLKTHFRTLEVIGTLSPLLGLLGTVLGMIEAFRRLEAAGSRVDPSILSGGIWEALLTTAVGLAVAIPAIAALNWFERRVERFAHRMDDAATRVFAIGIGARKPDAEPEAAPLPSWAGQGGGLSVAGKA